MTSAPFQVDKWEKLAEEAHQHNDIVILPYLDDRSSYNYLNKIIPVQKCLANKPLVLVQRQGQGYDAEDARRAVVE